MIDLDSRGCGQRMGRFVLPSGDPCTCTGVRLGSHYYRYAPEMQGQDPPLYMDMLPEVTAEVFGRWFNCTESKLEESTLGVMTPVFSNTPEPSMPPADCQEILDAGQNTSGVYTIRHKRQNMQVYCRMESGKGYIVFQRRQDGSVSFNRTWQEYAEGFGNLTGEFWLGNQKLHSLTRNLGLELVITLKAFDGDEARVRYEIFNVYSSEGNYVLYFDGFSEESGDAGIQKPLVFISFTLRLLLSNIVCIALLFIIVYDIILHSLSINVLLQTRSDDPSFLMHTGDSLRIGPFEYIYFSTPDKDHDNTKGENCAEKFHGGWWYILCGSYIKSNLNGLYYTNATVDDYMGIQWVTWKGKAVSLKGCEMMTRPKCNWSITELPADCQEILDAGQSTSGVYTIQHACQNMQVYCRMEPESGKGYIVFQRRQDGSVRFNRTWQEYAEGFGDLTGEFWLGNQKLRSLTRNREWELVITLRALDGDEARVRYEEFKIYSSESSYRLLVRVFIAESGDAGT
ncbi:angiopoietin-related protein 2-like [Patiria miniata]|uniref:Fibrinogen C-terminal domain-containing protein n=1 Tax=Patiria miniata TaxID=46514 RepID=A0A914AZ73_PATMI|nr:angiopoietin-related protein 2-like [Patiria miniata]